MFQGNDQIFGCTYTDTESHLPHVVTDAAGQPTTYTYTASKQLETITNAKSETTTLAYRESTVPAGYLALGSAGPLCTAFSSPVIRLSVMTGSIASRR